MGKVCGCREWCHFDIRGPLFSSGGPRASHWSVNRTGKKATLQHFAMFMRLVLQASGW